MFIDQVEIDLKAGDGGNGIVAFRREAMVENGGPFGGTGGHGADIIFEVDEGLRTLLDYKYNRFYKAKNGAKGQTKGKTGASSAPLILRVPPGTVIYDNETDQFIADLVKHKEQFKICNGGRGGRGNMALAKAGRHSLEISENGEPGEQKNIRLELKLISDVGLVGLPSVGKSTIISVISRVKPKIAAYHFTTLVPNLGVVKPKDKNSYVVADLPGLIEGAAQGKGLGQQFLRHIERTRLILHVLDMGSFEGRDPLDDFVVINAELKAYGFDLEQRKQLVVANKMDLPAAEDNLKRFKEQFPEYEVLEISALTKQGLEELINRTGDVLETISMPVYDKLDHTKKIYRYESKEDVQVYRDENGVLQVGGKTIEKIVAMTNFNTFDNIRRFSNQLKALGINEKLLELGVEAGETVVVINYEFQFDE